MKKILSLLVALMLAANPVFAASVALSDHEMDNIAAGDWQVIKDADGNETVVSDLYYSTNDIKLNDDSQKDIQAVSNANVVDSAVAVQTNIASVTGEEPINNNVSGSNVANLTNYNPSEEASTSAEYAKSFKLAKDESFTKTISDSYTKTKTENAWFLLTETLDIVYNKDISAALAIDSEEECKNCEKEFTLAATFLLNEDYNLDYDKNVNAGYNKSLNITDLFNLSINKTESLDIEKTESAKATTYYRKNLSENNHIDLEDTSQQLIQAVSNLNSVGSAAAIQTNIATNVGVAGTITHSNIATAINGL